MFPKRAAITTGVMSYIQNGVVGGPMHYDSRDSTPEIAIGSSLDSQNGNVGSNDMPKRPMNLGVTTVKAYVPKNLLEDPDDIEDGSLPCTPELQSESDMDVSSCPAGDEMLDQETRQLIGRFLAVYTGLSKLRWKENKELATMKRVVEGVLEKHRYAYNGMINTSSLDEYPMAEDPIWCWSEQNRADSPEPSCVSMKSDRSKNFPPSFNLQHSKESSDVSTDRCSPLDSKFMCLEENVVGFVKKELKKFKGMLSPDYPECPEECEDEEVVDEEEAQRRYSSKLVLDMTLLFMRRTNQGELAASLEKRSMRLSRSVAKNTKQNAAFPGRMSAIRRVFRTCFK